MKISVITPCYNSEKSIARTIESIIMQDYDDVEYIVIDGASQDKTIEIVKSYENKFKNGINIISEKDNGIYDAMNKGINLASGDIVAIINSDDYYEKDAFSNIIKEYESVGENDRKYMILYGAVRLINNDVEQSIILYNHNNLPNQMILHQGCFVTKALYKDKGGFDLDYKYSSDYDFMLRMFDDKEVVFKPVYKLVANFVLGGASGNGAAYVETHKLWYKRGLISKRRYLFVKFKYKLSVFIKGN